MKICNCCFQKLPKDNFNKMKSGNYTEWCKTCIKDYSLAERKERKFKYTYDIIKDIVKDSEGLI
jgi:uncharacterized protein CbrC (UPF0167 family)